MIYFIEAIIVLGLIIFPYSHNKGGAVEFQWLKGLVFGVNTGSVWFQAKVNDETEPRTFKMTTFQFHLAIFTISIVWSVERPDAIIDDNDDIETL